MRREDVKRIAKMIGYIKLRSGLVLDILTDDAAHFARVLGKLTRCSIVGTDIASFALQSARKKNSA